MILKRLTANEPDGLEEVSGLLHDSYGDQDLVRFDEDRSLLEFPIAQEIDTWMEVPQGVSARTRVSKRPRWPLSTLSIPFFQVNIEVGSASSFLLGPGDRDDPWMLCGITYDRARRQVRFEPVTGPTLEVNVTQLNVVAHITDRCPMVVKRRLGFLMESDSPQVPRFAWPPADAG